MEVTECDDDWDESDVRQRRWVTVDEAVDLLFRQELQELLAVAVGRLA